MSNPNLSWREGHMAVVFKDETFADLKRSMEDVFGAGARAVMYFLGRICGQRTYFKLSLLYQGKGLFQACIELKEQEGWGTFQCEINGDGVGTVWVEDCFEARGYGPSSEPVCHFVRGYIEGFLSSAFRKELWVTETSCIARGDRECVFEVRPAPGTAGTTLK